MIYIELSSENKQLASELESSSYLRLWIVATACIYIAALRFESQHRTAPMNIPNKISGEVCISFHARPDLEFVAENI